MKSNAPFEENDTNTALTGQRKYSDAPASAVKYVVPKRSKRANIYDTARVGTLTGNLSKSPLKNCVRTPTAVAMQENPASICQVRKSFICNQLPPFTFRRNALQHSPQAPIR